jgi:hypothetical protein
VIPVRSRPVGRVGRWLIRALSVGGILIAWESASLAGERVPGYEYLSPLPGARLVSPWNSVVLRPRGAVDVSEVRAALSVVGSLSGPHTGRLVVSDDARTLVFTPDLPFTENESVTVSLGASAGRSLTPLTYSFSVTPRDPRRSPVFVADEATGRLVPLERLAAEATDRAADSRGVTDSAPDSRAARSILAVPSVTAGDTLPPGMPVVTLVASNQPDPGVVFLAPFSSPQRGNLMIVDNAAQPLFYRRLHDFAFDWKVQQNGLLTYFSGSSAFYALDSTYAVVDSFRAGNGYTADVHDLQILPNGHALLLIYDTEPVRMDSVVPGGRPDAQVIGLVVQELDQAKNVVFQWRSWDHFLITDAESCLVSLSDSLVDYVHGNAVELDTDGNLLISSRSMNEITKIDRATGNIIWRWGLNAKNNQFAFANDPRGFAGQHDIRRLPNGNVTLFDNGNCLGPLFSRGVEYQLDEVNRIATLVWEARGTPDIYGPFMGNVQRRASGGTMIGWGGAGPNPKLTDLHVDGSIGLALGLGATARWTYRAFRFPWQTSRFAVTPEARDFGTVRIGRDDTLAFTIQNRSTEPLTINSIVGRNTAFSVVTPLPITIDPGASGLFDVRFVPKDPGVISDTLYVKSVSSTELIAQAVTVHGICEAVGVWIEDPVAQFEGNSGLTPLQFRVRIAAPHAQTVSVKYQTYDGTATAADSDYVPASARVFIPAGDTAAVFSIMVRGDTRAEPDESFWVFISYPINTVIDRDEVLATILDDDRFAGVDDPAAGPLSFALYPSQPNPARGPAVIRYDLPRRCHVRLDVFDLGGRRVESLVDADLPAGRHRVTWTPKASAAGVFFCRLRAEAFDASQKLVFVR